MFPIAGSKSFFDMLWLWVLCGFFFNLMPISKLCDAMLSWPLQGKLSCLMVNDIDAGIGRFGEYQSIQDRYIEKLYSINTLPTSFQF